jgi:hypothetical protein
LKKYHKFCTNPPRNYVKLCYVFTGSTGNYKHANTQSLSDSDHDDDHCVHLNLPPTISDLIEGPSCPTQKPKDKSKGKRKCDMDLQSSHSSKCSTKGEKVYTRITNKFDSIKDTIIRQLKIYDSALSIGEVSLLSVLSPKVLLQFLWT